MGYQNFFATRLFTDIGAADTTITLENPPTPTSGRLVLEARNTSKREIISYTGVSGNDITGVTRGVGGTSATDHKKNSLVEMNVVAEDLADALAVPSDIITRFDETISDHVASGLVVTDDTGLTADISAGVAYINGIRLPIAAELNHAFTASKDTYIDLGDNGVLDYNEVANNDAIPALAANHLRIARVITNATDTTSILNYQNGSFLPASTAWRNGQLPDVSTVTNNGAREYALGFASSVAGILSPQMRLRIIRKIQANTYMGGLFDGSTKYFTKVTPTSTLSTVTNNFTIEAHINPTANSLGMICGRAQSTLNNAIWFRRNDDGTLSLAVYNGGSANWRFIKSRVGSPTNKSVHVAATWASGTVTMYIDGVSVPVDTATTGGTAPTVAGTGGNWSIGRAGEYTSQYFTGYISNVAVYDAVLSQATIREHMTIRHLGTETNCIGAWSLDNTAVNQQNPGTNDLTATGGVGYTAASPFCNNGETTVVDYAVVKVVSGSTATVITPENCTIPATGGISTVSYSTEYAPLGFPSKSKFGIGGIGHDNITTAETTTAVGPVDIATFGPVCHVWVGPSGNLSVGAGAMIKNSGVAFAHMYVYIDGSNQAPSPFASVVNTNEVISGRTRVYAGLAQGWHTVLVRYGVGGGTGTYQQRNVTAHYIDDGTLF